MSTSRLTRHAAPLRQEITRLLREDILSGNFQPGDALRESGLCEAYDVSRTVVREALRQLEAERLVTAVAHHGPVVTVLTPRDIEQIYEVRGALEGLVGELFVARASEQVKSELRELLIEMESTYLRGTVRTREEANERFYGLLLEGASNPVLAEDVARAHARVQIFRRYAFMDDQRARISFEEFGRIIEAAAVACDAAAARVACEHHVRGAAALAVEEYRRRLA